MRRRGLWIVVLIVVLVVGGLWVKKDRAAKQASANTTTQATSALAQTYTYSGVEGKNAEELLQAKEKVEVKSYSFGDMIVSINGQAAPDGYFWEFLVNGQQASVGAGAYQTKATDTITWRLSKVTTQ